MLVIRLQRTGRTNQPTYRVVVTEKSAPTKSGEKEILGHYLPLRDPSVFEVDTDSVKKWIGNGAIPSDTVARLLKNSGMEGMEKYIDRYTKQKPRKEQPEEAAPPPPPAAEEAPAAEETPAEEAPKEEEKPAEEPAKEEAAPAEEVKEEPKEEEKPAEDAPAAEEKTDDSEKKDA